ncbi:phosphatase YcdX [Candidatus Methanoplasma termitum]|uniref:YcdX2 protein n=1 Tax=Candidatus Methanoplasma termitum TaxID=1577791 RepID=A0A0A7LFI5_9ARCH|nr:CehA/McbA family metallohydrolase [Candidatus Methanoplasma termitum]AIZ56256.1 phosphatase YcdX [Candidatus Methanoplasma termitum]MCL2333768.1 CehA/McbA family metallohydrolase [Candidatus Methanoplasma sp.]
MKADLHIHSNFSNDGKSTVEEIIEAAVNRGLGCIAITDHNSFEAYNLVKDNGKVIVIPGIEVSSKEGHILAYGIDRAISRDMSIDETINAIHEAGGVAFAAHPYRWWSGLGEENTLNFNFDGTEALNARSTARDNKRSKTLAERIGKPISAGSDAHDPEYVGDGMVEIPDDIRTWQDALKAVMEGKAKPSSTNRRATVTIRYGVKSIVEWIFRGFKRM